MDEKIALQRDFKGVWISKSIWLSKELSITEKCLLTEINSLDNDLGCFASNAYLADFLGLSPSRVSELISSLIKKKYIYLLSEKELTPKGWKTNRVIKVFENRKNPSDSRIPPSENRSYPSEKAEYINPSSNPIINTNNISCQVEQPDGVKIPIEQATMNYLNLKTGRNFKLTAAHIRLIKAREKEGYERLDFKKVIDNMVSAWKGTEMEKYLRPITLFSPKFDSYLNWKKK